MGIAIDRWNHSTSILPQRQSFLRGHALTSRHRNRKLPRFYRFSSPRSGRFDQFFTKPPSKVERKNPVGGDFIARLVDECPTPTVQITKSDDEFQEMGLEFMEGHEDIDLDSLNDLFVKVRFPRREPVRLLTALENSYLVLWIRYNKPSTRFVKRGQILGFARVISDGAFYSSIWDVAVLPSWQRNGLGRALIERLLVKLTTEQIPVISLYAERDVVGLYQKLGFLTDPEGMHGMAYSINP